MIFHLDRRCSRSIEGVFSTSVASIHQLSFGTGYPPASVILFDIGIVIQLIPPRCIDSAQRFAVPKADSRDSA